jgi:hypothetical protein
MDRFARVPVGPDFTYALPGQEAMDARREAQPIRESSQAKQQSRRAFWQRVPKCAKGRSALGASVGNPWVTRPRPDGTDAPADHVSKLRLAAPLGRRDDK